MSLAMCQVSCVRCQTSDVRCLVSYVMLRCQVSSAMCKVSPVRCQVSCVSCEMSEKATARNTDLEQEPVVQMQWPKVFLENKYGLFKVFGLFLLNIYHLVMLKF